MSITAPKVISRRQGLFVIFGGVAVVGCGAGATQAALGDGGSSSGSSGSSADEDSGTNSDSGSSKVDGGGSATQWAKGGTAAMTGGYSDPFPATLSNCAVGVAVTQGPCTEAADQVRTDISEGYAGLPMRLALKIVDTACNPIAGAKVKVWHTQVNGSYSGDTPNNNMCLKSQADATKHYFRGVQTSDAKGRVDFDSCFPGWYRGRTVHIHYTVTVGNKSFTSQLVFDQALVQEVFESHDDYKGFGQPDTSNSVDNVVGNQNLSSFTLETARLADGAMMAFKAITVA
jgi:protocatechuate 3,4-dioxygenase beta subunit